MHRRGLPPGHPLSEGDATGPRVTPRPGPAVDAYLVEVRLRLALGGEPPGSLAAVGRPVPGLEPAIRQLADVGHGVTPSSAAGGCVVSAWVGRCRQVLARVRRACRGRGGGDRGRPRPGRGPRTPR